MNMRPIVLHSGHIPVVTFFGPVLIIFWVFRRPIKGESNKAAYKSKFLIWRGEGDLNPRVLADMGLAIPRPTRLGDPRIVSLKQVCK